MSKSSSSMKEKVKEANPGTFLKRDVIILMTVFSVLSFIYFLSLGKYIFAFQEEQFLFIFSSVYLKSFLAQPGGLLEYAGKFLMQFYELPLTGSVILTLSITFAGYLVYRIINALRPGSNFSAILSISASSLLLLMQSQYYHFMQYNLGYIVVLLFFFLSIKLKNSYLPVIFFPFLLYVAGAFSLYYLVMYCLLCFTTLEGRSRVIKPLLAILAGLLTYYLFIKVLFFIPAKTLLTCQIPLIDNRYHKVFIVLLSMLMLFLPLTGRFDLKIRKVQVRKFFSPVSGVLIILLTGYMSLRLYNPMISDVLRMEKAAYESDWDEVINIENEHHTGNLISQYCYNTALAEKGLLCENLFSINQSSGTNSLILPWGDEHLERGALFFYAAGLVNEAHRWAYEEMVVYGFRPHNILMLIRTNLINHKFGMAQKYIEILKKTLFYHDDALHYEGLLGQPEKILGDAELGPVEKVIPAKDFFMYLDLPENNLPELYESNQQNVKAFEYMMAWLLLEKNVETVVSNIHLMKPMGYRKLPKNIEEAVMIYYNSQHSWPDLGGLSVSSSTLTRFDQYINTFIQVRNNNPARLQELMRSEFGDTFWYYFHFNQLPVAGKK